MRYIRFSNDPSAQHIDSVARLLKAQRRLFTKKSDYPGHEAWTDRTITQIAADAGKRAIVATWGSEALGLVIYQRHPSDVTMVEVRNLSVRAKAEGLPVAHFLLGIVAREAAHDFPGTETLIGNAKITNEHVIDIATTSGWNVTGITTLVSPYGHNGIPDVVMTRSVIDSSH